MGTDAKPTGNASAATILSQSRVGGNMHKDSVKVLKKAWQKYQASPTDKNREEFLRQFDMHHFSVFSCLELYSR